MQSSAHSSLRRTPWQPTLYPGFAYGSQEIGFCTDQMLKESFKEAAGYISAQGG